MKKFTLKERMYSKLTVILLFSTLLFGCAKNTAYRDKSAALCVFGDEKCNSSLEASDPLGTDPIATVVVK